MPAALTLILICPWPGSGSGTPAHFSTSGGPYPVITIALGMAAPFWQRPRYGRGRQISACSLGVFPCPIGRAWPGTTRSTTVPLRAGVTGPADLVA